MYNYIYVIKAYFKIALFPDAGGPKSTSGPGAARA